MRAHVRAFGSALVSLLVSLPAAPARADTDWVLILDRSESMTQNDPGNHRFDAQKIMVDLLAQGVGETHRLTIVRFAATADVVLNRAPIRDDNLAAIQSAISVDPPQGDTDIGAALKLARETVNPEGRASDVKVILLSDGVLAGRSPAQLREGLEAEKMIYQEIGLAVSTIILNDMSIPENVRTARREERYSYDDKTLQEGEDRLRDLARKTRGRSAQVLPTSGIEDILLALISPYMSFYRESITGRIRMFPTDRQLFIVLNKSTVDARFRLGTQEVDVDLREEKLHALDFSILVRPYSNRTVVMIRPGETTRWPEWVDILPGPSSNQVEGDIYVISNVRLSIVPGFGAAEPQVEEGVKTRIRENEVYPILFRITLPDDVTADRRRTIQDTLKQSEVRINVIDADGRPFEESKLPAGAVFAGTGNRLFFVPTSFDWGEAKLKEAFALTVRASLDPGAETAVRSIARAPDRPFVVFPSSFDWIVRRNWRGEPESASRPVSGRLIELELGQEFRLEVLHGGSEVLGSMEIVGEFSKAGDTAARKLPLRDMGGLPRTFRTDWIFAPTVGEYAAKVTLKTDVVQEVKYRFLVVRDDFRPEGAQYSADGTDGARARDLGSYVVGERIPFERRRVIDRLSADATRSYWESESANVLRAPLLKKDPATGSWAPVRQVQLDAVPPAPGGRLIAVGYSGAVLDLDTGDYLLAWPEKRPLGADPSSDPRADAFSVLGPPLLSRLLGEDSKPLAVQDGKAIHQAGKPLILEVSPTETFPTGASEELLGTLTWARKDVGLPQVVKALKAEDGKYAITFPTTDFHTGAAKLALALRWKREGRDRQIEESFDIVSLPKALGLSMEPLVEDVYLGQKASGFRFRIQAIGGQNQQIQRDLMSLWLSSEVNATIGDSESIYRVRLESEGESLVGSLDLPDLPPGTYKLVVNSTVAKLGQDIAGCFFDVKAPPFAPRILKSASGADQKVLLEPGVARADCDGEGVFWAQVETAKSPDGRDPGAKLDSATLSVNGKPLDVGFVPLEGGGLRSEAIPLEELDATAAVQVSARDDGGRVFDWSVGTLTVKTVPMAIDVTWASPPPRELGRGTFCRARGSVVIRGGTRSGREGARDVLRAAGPQAPFVVATPPSVLKSFEVLPAAALRQEGAAVKDAAFGEQVPFELTLQVRAADSEVRDQISLEVRGPDGKAIDARRISIGLSATRLVLGRPAAESQTAAVPVEGMPITTGERARAVVEVGGDSELTSFRIQVFGPGAEQAPGARPLVSGDSRLLDWAAKKEGTYRVVAEAYARSDFGWGAEEELVVAPGLKLSWSQAGEGPVKLDAGQFLPLFVKVHGPPSMDLEGFLKLFSIRPEVLGEGGQLLAVDFSPWEVDRSVAGGGVAVKAFSTKAIPSSAARLRVSLDPRARVEGAVALDVLEREIVRGGGSLVMVEDFEKGAAGYRITDVTPGSKVPKGSRVRFGYRTGSTLADMESLKDRISATVVSLEGGAEKVLDIESISEGLAVFTPYEALEYGKYKVHLEIKGELTQLRQEPEFEVTEGVTESVQRLILGVVGLVLLGALAFLGKKGLDYGKDRKVVVERVNGRMDKALAALEREPRERLAGEIRIAVAGKTLGPVELGKAASMKEVSAWVDQHFSRDPVVFSDDDKNRKRLPMIERCLSGARTELLAQTEKRLPVRAADICIQEPKGGPGGRVELRVVQDAVGAEHEGLKTALSLRILEGGKIRVSTISGKSMTFGQDENHAFNGWIGKTGSQIRASVKIPGFAEYSTVTIDLK